jgi:hypothetical protein
MLYLALAASGVGVALAGTLLRVFPMECAAAALGLPFLAASALRARGTYTKPRLFVPAIRAIVACYALTVLLFTLGVVAHRALS